VSVLVRSWADGTLPNHGVILGGPKGATPNNDDDTCVATLGGFRLTIQHNVAGNP
jgi:hypothetical protein